MIRRFLSNPVLSLAVFTGISSLVLTFAGGYFYSILSRNENVTVKYVASPVAVATLLGVLSSRARHFPSTNNYHSSRNAIRGILHIHCDLFHHFDI
jgi:hypothetical protein